MESNILSNAKGSWRRRELERRTSNPSMEVAEVPQYSQNISFADRLSRVDISTDAYYTDLRSTCQLSAVSSSDNSQNNIHKNKNRWKNCNVLLLVINLFFIKMLDYHSKMICCSFSTVFRRSNSCLKRTVNIQLYLTKLLVCLAIFPVCSLSHSSTSSSLDLWENEITLDQSGNYRNFVVQWTPSYDRIVFRVTARTRGYIGFGFHDKPKMDGADIVVGWVHSGKLYLQDRYGKGNEAPHVDRQQDWDLIGGFENDTHTVLIMSRPFVTCDPNDYPITNDTVRLLWAYHPDDPVDPESPRPRLHYHGGARRGSTTLFLLQRAKESIPRRPLPINYPRSHYPRDNFQPSTDTPLSSWSLIGPPATIFSDIDSVHWCRLFKRPRLSRKHHVVRYEPVLTREGRKYVHHMMMYECVRLDEDDEILFDELTETSGSECSQPSMQTLLAACNQVVVAWALGSEGVWLPREAGYPLTPDGPRFYMLETHYDVPLDTPISDYSGVRLLHTPALRNHDAGVLSVGLHPNWKHIIPPKQGSVLSEGHCVGECTHAAFPSTGINVFGVIFHTHLLGRQVRLRHLRGDHEFEPLASDFNYQFKYQEYRHLRETRNVMPGDHLIGECRYNSEECSSITLGGFKTRDEMCLSFLFYYPKVDLSYCHSKPSLKTVLQSLGIQELSEQSNPITIRLPVDLAGKTLKWRLQNYDWENHSEFFQQATHAGTFNPKCRGNNIAPDLPEESMYPNVTKPWKPHQECERQKKKNKKRKKKMGGRRPANPHDDEIDDVMVDDETSLKLIERIDVDPIQSFDRFMPVISDSGVANINNRRTPISTPADSRRKQEETLLSEFEQMERDLENEVRHHNHNNNQPPTHHLPAEVFHPRPSDQNHHQERGTPSRASSSGLLISSFIWTILSAIYIIVF